MTFCKYSFTNPTEWAKYKAQITDNDGNPVNCAIVELGQICLAHDEEGNCTHLSPLYAVDILWTGDIPSTFAPYQVWPAPVGIHTFAGWEDSYAKEFCVKFPDHVYCKIDESLI